MKTTGVDYYAVSSTTVCEEDYERAINEIKELIRIDEEHVLPVMWITPDGLNGNVAWYLESSIEWKMIKIHPELHPAAWFPPRENIKEVIDIAKELMLPILIHTGNFDSCHALKFDSIIGSNPDVLFVLAHGRPLKETVSMIYRYDNVYADSAFMSIEDMKELCDAGLSNKLLWGTDMCIPKHFYPDEDMKDYYLRKLSAFRNVCEKEDFDNVTYRNAKKLFKIDERKNTGS